MNFELRAYQKESADKAVAFLTQPKPNNGIVVVPTGGGKSLIITDIGLRLPAPCIVFQPSKEILEQNHAKFCATGYRPAIYSASLGKRQVGRITLATIGSVRTRPELFEHCRFIIIDEAHLASNKNEESMFAQFLSAHPDARLLGLTATPFRLHTNSLGCELRFLTRTRPRVFTKVVHVVQIQDLVRDGYWAKLEYKVVKTGFRKDRLRLNSTGADYTDESVRNHFRELHFSDQIVRCCMRLDELGRGGTLVFCRFVEEAEYVASKLKDAAVVSAETPKEERDEITRAFRAGEIRRVCNVGIYQIGFDYPELRNVVLAQPTRSLARYYQSAGRVVRPHPSKESAWIIDMVGLSQEFGKIEDLVIHEGPNEKWFVACGEKQLTNVYFGGDDERINYARKSVMNSVT